MTPASITPTTTGWAIAGGGRAANVSAGTRYAGTTSQLCGLFPFAVASGATLTGVPLGRSLHTAEPVGLDPAHWLRTGLISNTGVWVQGQPGIGKSSITKRLVVGLVGFGLRALIPGDIKGEYTPLITALGGTVWRLGRGHHTLNPLDPGLAAPALAAAVGTQRQQIGENLRTRNSPSSRPCWPSPADVRCRRPGGGCSPPRWTRPPPPGSNRPSPTYSTPSPSARTRSHRSSPPTQTTTTPAPCGGW